MRLATTEQHLHSHGLRAAFARGVTPAVGFSIPDDVVKDPHLPLTRKREILSSWASDASAVQDEPTLRWLLGTPEPVPFTDVRDALLRLERRTGELPWASERVRPRPAAPGSPTAGG